MKTVIVLALFAASVVAGRSFLYTREAFPYADQSRGIKIELTGGAGRSAERSVYSITAGDIQGEAVIQSGLGAAEGASMVNAQIFGVKSTFKASPAPYAGHITSTIDCGAQKFVSGATVPFGGRDTDLVLAVASARKVFGVCTLDQVKYASVYWAAYDVPEKRVVVVKLFKPVDNPARLGEAQQEVLAVFNQVISRRRLRL